MCLCVAVYVYIQGTDWWRWMGRLFWGKHTHKSSLWSRTGETPAFSFLRPCPHVSECFKMWLCPKSPNQNSHYVTTNGIPHEKASQVVVCKKKSSSVQWKKWHHGSDSTCPLLLLCVTEQRLSLTVWPNKWITFYFQVCRSLFSKTFIDFSQPLTHKKTSNSLFWFQTLCFCP